MTAGQVLLLVGFGASNAKPTVCLGVVTVDHPPARKTRLGIQAEIKNQLGDCIQA